MKGRRLRALGLALLGVVSGMLVSIAPPVSAHDQTVDAPSIVSLAADGTLTVNITDYNSNYPNYWRYEICETPGCGVWSSNISFTSTGQTTASVTGHTNWNQGKLLYVRTRGRVTHFDNPPSYSHPSSTGFVYVPLTLSFSKTDSTGSLTYNIQVQPAYKVTFWICSQASSTQSSAYCSSTTKTTSTPVGANTKDMSAVALPGGGTFDPTEYYYFYIQAETSAGYKTAIVGKPYYQDQRLCTPEISPPVDFGNPGNRQGPHPAECRNLPGKYQTEPHLGRMQRQRRPPQSILFFHPGRGRGCLVQSRVRQLPQQLPTARHSGLALNGRHSRLRERH